MSSEVWKWIPGHEGVYMVSNLGRLKSIGKVYRTRYNTYAVRKDRLFKCRSIDTYGYVSVNIIENGKLKGYTLHRLVALAFIPNPQNKRCVNHKNGVKHDNRVENLEWMTHSENSIHSFQIGLQCNKGENHPSHKVTNEIVREIRQKFVPRKYSSRRLAKEYGMSKTNILDIVNNRRWTHI